MLSNKHTKLYLVFYFFRICPVRFCCDPSSDGDHLPGNVYSLRRKKSQNKCHKVNEWTFPILLLYSYTHLTSILFTFSLHTIRLLMNSYFCRVFYICWNSYKLEGRTQKGSEMCLWDRKKKKVTEPSLKLRSLTKSSASSVPPHYL